MNLPRLPVPLRYSKAAFIILSSGTCLSIALFAASAWLAADNFRRTEANDIIREQIRAVQFAAQTVLSTLKDAEAGQRGYLLTGDVAYLKPYDNARERLGRDLTDLEHAPMTTPEKGHTLAALRILAAAKLAELAFTIKLFRSGETTAALDIVRVNQGQQLMQAVRETVDAMQADVTTQVARTLDITTSRRDWGIASGCGTIAAMLLLVIAWSEHRSYRYAAASLSKLERFTKAFGLVPGIIRDQDGRIVYWSPGAERTYGYRAHEAVGQIGSILLQTQHTHPLAVIEAAFKQNGFWHGEVTNVAKNGKRLHIATTWATHAGDVKGAASVIEVGIDISDRKRIEDNLRDSETKLRVALDASGQGVWQWEMEAGIIKVFWDARCRALFGVCDDTPVDSDYWAQAISEQDRIATQTIMARALDPTNPTDDYVIEHRIQHPVRGEIWLSALGKALFEADQTALGGRRAVRIVGTTRDITQAKHAEEARAQAATLLQTIIHTAPGLIFAKDLQGRMLLANASVLEVIGKTWDQVAGRTDADFLEDTRTAEVIMRNDRRVMALGQSEKLEESVPGPEGKERIFVSTKAPMMGADGAVVGLVGVSVDITEQKRVQLRLRLMLNELNHRVKNTLATVLALSSHTLRQLDPAARENFESRLLALASAHDVLTREHWSGADLRDVVAEALAPFDGWNTNRFWISGPALSLRPSAALALSMALHELVTNAVKYGALSESFGRVEIRWETTDLDPPELVLLWTERGGPTVVQPVRKGFGIRLVEKGLASSIPGTSRICFDDPQGVTCVIQAPLSDVTASSAALAFPHVGEL